MSNTAENPGRLKTFWLPVLLGISVGANLMLLVGSESAPKVAHGETGTASNGFVMTSFVMQGKGAAEGLAIFESLEIDGERITPFRGAIHIDQLALLFLKDFDDVVDITFTDLAGKSGHLEVFDLVQ